MINVIVAHDINGVIGIDGDIPWYIPEDLKRFKQLTDNSVVVMGRKTYESLRVKPLPNRTNMVLSRSYGAYEFLSSSYKKDLIYCPDYELILDLYHNEYKGKLNLWIIGGEEIYKLFLPHCDRIYITKVNIEADINSASANIAHFPRLNENRWNLYFKSKNTHISTSGVEYYYENYERFGGYGGY